jgi:hypothetical protein
MAIRRRRVYYDYSYSRRMRIEGWLSLSILLSAGIFLLSLFGSLPEVKSLILRELRPDGLPYQLGVISRAEQVSLFATICEILMAVSGAYLALALFVRSHAKQAPR